MTHLNGQQLAMDDLLQRILDRVANIPEARGRELSWLAHKIGVSVQATTNWKARGVPPKHLAAISSALAWEMDEMLGRTPSHQRWPFEIDFARFNRLSERQKGRVEAALLRELERLEDEERHRPQEIVGNVVPYRRG